MKIINVLLSLIVSTLICGAASSSYADATEGWVCQIDGKEWKETGGATLNMGNLTLYSSDDHMEGIYIMTLMPAMVGSYALNEGAQASFTEASGANHKAKAGSGKLDISKYTAPEGETKGRVEGTFSGVFGESGKEHTVKDCKFNLSLRNL